MKDWKQKGVTVWDYWMASLTQWAWVWTNSKRQWRTEKPGMLQSIGPHRVGQDLVTEQQQQCKFVTNDSCTWPYIIYYQIRSVIQLCPTLCDPMNRSTPGLPVHHQLPEFTQTHIQRISDAIQLSHPLSSPSPLAPNPSQHQSLFQWVNSLHEVAKVLQFQL